MEARSQSPYQLPHTFIPYLPPEIDAHDLHGNLCLLTDAELALVYAKLEGCRDRRYTKKELNLDPKFSLSYSILVHDGEIYILYHGRKKEKHAGIGDFGVVKYLQHAKSKEWFAIKVMSTRHYNFDNVRVNYTPEYILAYCNTELEMLKKFDLVKGALGMRVSEMKGLQYYIVMRAALGQDLFEYMQKHQARIHPYHFIDLFKQVILAVSEMHAKGFLHRDVKPENFRFELMLTLLDFGLTVPIPESGEFIDNQIYGAKEKRAPEIFNGCYSIASDSFACGATIADLLNILAISVTEFDLAKLVHKDDECQQGNITLFDSKSFNELYDLCAAMMRYKKEERMNLSHALLKLNAIQQALPNPELTISVLNVADLMKYKNDDIRRKVAQLVQHCHEVVMLAPPDFVITPEVIYLRQVLLNKGLKVYPVVFRELDGDVVMQELMRLHPDVKWVRYELLTPRTMVFQLIPETKVEHAPQAEFFKAKAKNNSREEKGEKKCLVM